MKNYDFLIQDVTLARCETVVEGNSKVFNSKAEYVKVIEFTVEKTITCVVDKKNGVAIDIETCKEWPIIKKDENNRIIQPLSFGQLYPVVFKDKNWDEISSLYQLSIKARAKQVYQRYLENIQNAKDNKIKNKTKEI